MLSFVIISSVQVKRGDEPMSTAVVKDPAITRDEKLEVLVDKYQMTAFSFPDQRPPSRPLRMLLWVFTYFSAQYFSCIYPSYS